LVASKFMDRILDELIEQHIWPRLFVLPPANGDNKLVRTLI
jgi:hypothetical protein